MMKRHERSLLTGDLLKGNFVEFFCKKIFSQFFFVVEKISRKYRENQGKIFFLQGFFRVNSKNLECFMKIQNTRQNLDDSEP